MSAILDSVPYGERVAVVTMTGTCCPVTLAHVQAFVEARRILLGCGYAVVLGGLSLNADRYVKKKLDEKGLPAIDFKDRVHLVELAILEYPWLECNHYSDWKTGEEDYCAWYQERCPHLKFVHFLLNGADDVLRRKKYNWKNVHQIVMCRPGSTEGLKKELRKQRINLDSDSFILGPELPDISSTEVREALVKGDQARLVQLLHEDVALWCWNKGPYRPPDEMPWNGSAKEASCPAVQPAAQTASASSHDADPVPSKGRATAAQQPGESGPKTTRAVGPADNPGNGMTPSILRDRWQNTTPGPLVSFYSTNRDRMGEWAIFSNFYQQRPSFEFNVPPSFCVVDLTERERSVPCEFSEKAIMLCKAAAFGDKQTYAQIAKATQGAEAKSLGRQIRGFKDEVWQHIVCSVAFEIVFQKFSKTPWMGEILLGTGDKLIAEMTKNDSNWGTGIDIGHKAERDPRRWPGTNILGWALMEARQALRRNVEVPRPRDTGKAPTQMEPATEPGSSLNQSEKVVLKLAKKLRDIFKLETLASDGTILDRLQSDKVAGKAGDVESFLAALQDVREESGVAAKVADVTSKVALAEASIR